jgi:circadian clock protein KaiB
MVSGTLFISRAQNGHEATVAHTQALMTKRYGTDFALEVVDVLEDPDRADAAHVVATPVLIVVNGAGEQRFIGDLNPVAAATKL